MPKNSQKGVTWQDIKFMRQACLLCDKSTLAVRTGCILVKESAVIGEGWNTDVHAELNAISQAVLEKKDLCGVIVYVSRFPCPDCAKVLVKNDIVSLFYMSDHFTGGNSALPFFKKSGISVIQIPVEIVWKNTTLIE
jgi:deoxycytidylate deaminase